MESSYYEHWGTEDKMLDASQKDLVFQQSLEKLQHLSLAEISETPILQEAVIRAAYVTRSPAIGLLSRFTTNKSPMDTPCSRPALI